MRIIQYNLRYFSYLYRYNIYKYNMEIIKIDQLQTEGHDIAGLVSTQFVDFSIIILFFHLYSIKRRREKMNYVTEKIGKFTGAEVIAACPIGSRSAVLNALNKLTKEEIIVKCGSGRGTFYVRKDAMENENLPQ